MSGFALARAALCCAILPTAWSQAPANPRHADRATYREAVDLALSGRTLPPLRGGWRLTLTFVPSFDPEARVVLVRDAEGTYSVERLAATTAIRRLADGQQAEQGRVDPASVAQRAGVLHHVESLSRSRGDELLRQYWRALQATLSAAARESRRHRDAAEEFTVHLDATTYVAHFEGAEETMVVEVLAPDDASRSAHPLVRWMGSVRSPAGQKPQPARRGRP